MTVTIIIILVIAVVGTLGFISMSRDAQRIHGAIDAFLVRASEATNADELLNIRKELVAYHNTECWHRNLGQRAREVINYIDGRRSGIRT